MNKMQLRASLRAIGAPPDSYDLDGEKNEALCLFEFGGAWEIYYSERGIKTEKEVFQDDESACDRFLNRIREMLNL